MPNAIVLPDPVGARPHTSRPASASGSVADWTGNGVVMPRDSRPPVMRAGTPSAAKVGEDMGVAPSGRGGHEPAHPEHDPPGERPNDGETLPACAVTTSTPCGWVVDRDRAHSV